MLTPLRLFIDIDGKSLVTSDTNPQTYTVPTLVQGDTVQLEIMLLKRSASWPMTISNPYSVVAIAGLSLRVGIGTPTASTGSPTPGIYQNTFAVDTSEADKPKFTGTLAITASAVATLLGSATSGTATLEIEVSEAGAYTTIYQGQVTLLAELIEGAAGSPPVPADSYMTAAESNATFVPKTGAAGGTILLTSPDGTKQVLLYCGDDGSFHADAVT